MRTIRVSENIIPVSQFKARTAKWLRHLGKTAEPLVITQNGRAAGVLLSPSAYDELTERYLFTRAVEQGLADGEAGRMVPHEQVAVELRRRLGGSGNS